MLKKHKSVTLLHELEKTQWLSSAELKEVQSKKLSNFLHDITVNVPYYKSVFQDLGINANDIKSANDLKLLPVLTKKIIREHESDLKAKDAAGLSRYNTGGSSGEPLIFYIGNGRVSHDVAAKWRATRWWGVDIGDPEIVVWGSPIELGGQDHVKAIRDKFLRTKLVPAFEMSEQKLDEFISIIKNDKPKMLFGYPSSLSLIASHAEKRNVDLGNIGIKVAFVTSEKLYDYQREKIEAIFKCPVANGYGGRDAGFIAHQCPEGNLHITAEDIIVEIVDADDNVLPNGEEGEIVITNLSTRDFPFVRYKIGDVGIISDEVCSCGRGLPLLAEIKGRSTDFIVAQDGTIMHGLALIYVLRDLPGIETFKIVQESLQLTNVDIVVDEIFDKSNIDDIKSAFKQRLGASVQIEVNLVKEIAAEKSGKFRYVISKVNVQ